MMTAVLLFAAWMIVGAIVVESCRIWRAWWLDVSFDTMLLWPLILLLTVMGEDQ